MEVDNISSAILVTLTAAPGEDYQCFGKRQIVVTRRVGNEEAIMVTHFSDH